MLCISRWKDVSSIFKLLAPLYHGKIEFGSWFTFSSLSSRYCHHCCCYEEELEADDADTAADADTDADADSDHEDESIC